MMWVRVIGLVEINGPAIAENIGSCWDVETFIRVCFGQGVRRTSQNDDRTPAEDLFAEGTDVR